MNDKDLKQLFGQLKKEESHAVPDFDELLARPEPTLKGYSGRLRRLRLISRIAVAASILLVATIGIWQFSGLGNFDKQEELALDDIVDTQNENILNWEPATDELLPTENSQTNRETKIQTQPQPIVKKSTQNTKKVVLTEATTEMIAANPELNESLFKNGSISDWESPTDYLMPIY